jgi:hypothetical protein
VHEATVSDRSENGWERNIQTKYAGAHITIGYRDSLTRPERDRGERSAIFLQRGFVFGASIKIVEYDLWQPVQSHGSQIVDVNDARLSE